MSTTPVHPQVHGIFDPATWTVTYVVYEKPGSADRKSTRLNSVTSLSRMPSSA